MNRNGRRMFVTYGYYTENGNQIITSDEILLTEHDFGFGDNNINTNNKFFIARAVKKALSNANNEVFIVNFWEDK